jgi:hypothetical protein
LRSQLGYLLVAAGLWAACTDPVDRAAKKRIFSPEDPPQVVASAKEKLPPESAADDSQVARRILEMGAAEETERLGPHEYAGKVTFQWTAAGATTDLSESRSFVAGRGGVSGDFDARLENSRDQGFEVLRVGGHVFAKDRYGKFRERRRDRGMAERTLEDVHGALRDFASVFDHHLRLSFQGKVTYEGRTALRYEVGLATESLADSSSTKPPPIQFSRLGPDEPSKRRQTFFAKRHFKSILGEVLVDAETSVVLQARLEGKLDVPGNPTALLTMSLASSIKRIGQEAALKQPADFLQDQDKPAGIAEVLDRFGIPRGGHADGGMDTELPDEEQ